MKKLILIVLFALPLVGFSQWNLCFEYDKPIYALDALNPDTVYIVGKHCAIRTLDGGNTWFDINYDCESLFFEDVEFPTQETGYIIGRPSTILKTENYGNSWEIVYQISDSSERYVELEFISQDTGWIIGQKNGIGDIIMRTYDGGMSWNYQYPQDPLTFVLNDINMVNHEIGYITHGFGMLKTIDGGDTWIEINQNTGGSNCCSFLNPDFGYIGSGGGVARTENGGQDWTFILSQTLVGLLGRSQLQFINADTGYYAGHDALASVGVIARTTNGGYEWEETRGKYYDIDMYDSDTGYCIKYTGEVYKTTNGGILVGNNEYVSKINYQLFPNPATDNITIQAYYNKLNIYNQIGQRVMHLSNYKNKIDISRLKRGLYIVEIITNRCNIKKKLIVK